ncbi:MAG TPA: hypothetical protein VIL35_05370 [Vicinamibacterales bacterium]
MIGVATTPEALPVAQEFFELFKTPWEPAVPGRRYAAVLGCGSAVDHLDGEAVVLYEPDRRPDGARVSGGVAGTAPLRLDAANGVTIPLYTSAASGIENGIRLATDRVGRPLCRFGYDLFAEVRHLLTEGQPERFSAIPTLDLHIELLRRALRQLQVPFVEIPPRPAGYDFTCCLTHDIDFHSLRRSRVRPLLGFAWRASVGSALDVLRGRRPVSEAALNWVSLVTLPLVLLGLARDPWQPFRDYGEADAGIPATYFVIPFAGQPGLPFNGAVRADRAVAYGVGDVQGDARAVLARGDELAVHGIDAWHDAASAGGELAAVAGATGTSSRGVRMHWLYFTTCSPRVLEDAGFEYDSTCGYNGAVGYRAGTAQVFKPLSATRLLELPLSVMDTALFFTGRMGLSRSEARARWQPIVDHARRTGGPIVINWHDRSLAPERLWREPYETLLADVKGAGRVWFASAQDAVAWFRWRRSIRFDVLSSGVVRVHSASRAGHLPAATITISRPQPAAVPELVPHDGSQPQEVRL